MTGASPSAIFATDLKVNMTPTTVSIRTSSTVNNYGERTFSGGTTAYEAYVRAATQMDYETDSEEKIAEYIVYIPHQTLTLDVDDELTLSAPISGIRPIVKVDTMRDALGQVALIVRVGRSR